MRKRILGACLAAIVVAMSALPAFAQIHEPDVAFEIIQVEAYESVLEEDDQLYIFTHNSDYLVTPTQPISEAFLFRLMNGPVELGSVAPFPYQDNGYDRGIATLYFDAASAPAWNPAVPYTVEFIGNPTQHWLARTAVTAMAGAVADDGGVQTDETAESNSVVANDMTLLPAAIVAGDAYYFGSLGMFDILTINMGTAGNWTGTYVWEYWNGLEWRDLTGAIDDSVGFTTGTDTYDVTWTASSRWQQSTIDSILAYWVRMRVVTATATVVQPLGTQSWTNTLASPPSISTDSWTRWYQGTSVLDTQDVLTTRLTGLAAILENTWGVDLIDTVSGVQKLSPLGETYFTNAIPGVKRMTPDLFTEVQSQPTFDTEVVVGEFVTGGDNADHDVFGVTWYGQTFTATSDYTMSGVQLRDLRVGGPVGTIVSLRAVVAGLPAGPDLRTAIIQSDFTTVDIGAWYEWTFTDSIALTAGTQYAIVQSAVGGNAANFPAWRYNDGSLVYIGGGGASPGFFYIGSTLAAGGVFYIGSSIFSGGSFYVGTSAGGGSVYAGGQAVVSGDSGVTWAAIAGGSQDFMFVTLAQDDFVASMRNRLANRLVGTPFDMTNLGVNLGMSRMWASTLVWLIFVSLPITVYVCRAAKSFKPGTMTMMLLFPMGALTGFVYLEVAVLAAFLSGAAAIYVFFFAGSGA